MTIFSKRRGAFLLSLMFIFSSLKASSTGDKIAMTAVAIPFISSIGSGAGAVYFVMHSSSISKTSFDAAVVSAANADFAKAGTCAIIFIISMLCGLVAVLGSTLWAINS